MRYGSSALERLISEFSKMPGIGRKSAQRLAFYILRAPREEAVALARAIMAVKQRVRHCSICHNITEEDPCDICREEGRDRGVICVVEEPGDLLALERTGKFKGRYHVLGGVLSPLDGVGPEDLNIQSLLNRLDGVQEVILATNAGVEGEATALYLAKLMKPLGVKVSRIARGLPAGGDLEYADEVTLIRALEGRVEAP